MRDPGRGMKEKQRNGLDKKIAQMEVIRTG